ncbi:unnamed protein product (macronuclear) [Paramecium tetraurelia]|uniref:Chorein N-terminal domain-containing protein n=1 Tax=Paramecium tetraurelia TaxID=5888 RepID=A0D6V2_PARTE|nr:uncharacterized protein GSPATT00001810001 [Paramecium tetraurelia]CAK78769.1 unnamed protein product [Paramecium tetraurelia]|eukprot:XP_001446166.1 hypothetical protein (macronuclear) [Paramecium tetraurelia strain d4-2]
MFEPIFSFFGGLATKAKSKIIEKTLQPIIDYNFENIFEQKIAIKDLNKGITNVKLNTKYLNGMMKTNTLKEFSIKLIKLEKLQLLVSDVDLTLDLNTQIKQEEALESLEVEDIMNKSIQKQIEQLKNEFLNQNDDTFFQEEIITPPAQQNEQKQPSSKIVQILRIIDSIFGNIKIDIQNLRVKFTGKIKPDTESNISFRINKIDCTMQKPQNSNQILFLAFVDQIKLYLDENKQIGQINNAVKLDVFLTQNTEPKIKIQAEQLQIVASLSQIDQISSLFAQSAQVLEQRQTVLNEVLKLSSNDLRTGNLHNQQSEQLRKTINLNKYMLEEYFKKSYNLKYTFIQEIEESRIIVQDISDTKIQDFCSSVKQMNEQQEFLNFSFKGLILYITSTEVDQEFNYQQQYFKVNLENYYSISLYDIRAIKNNNKLNIFVNSAFIYELQKLDPRFKSIRDSVQQVEQDFDIIGDQKCLCKIILKTGKDQYSGQDLFKDGCEILIEEPTIFVSQIQFVSPIKLEIMDQTINMDMAPFNLILDQNQLKFIMSIVDIINDNQPKTKNQNISKGKFQLSKTKFSAYYHVNESQSIISSTLQPGNEDYVELKFFDFFITTPEDDKQQSSSYQYKNQFKFGCPRISGVDNQILINNLSGYFGSLLKISTERLKQLDEQNKPQILKYLKECKQRQALHFELELENVYLKHDQLDNVYTMIAQLNQVFNGNQKQQQNNQKKQQNIYFSTKIKTIEATIFDTLIFCFKQFKYYFTIDYHFILLEDLNASFKNNPLLLLQNQVQDKWVFSLIMKQNRIKLEFSALKLNLLDFNFQILSSCIIRLIKSVQLMNPPQQPEGEKKQILTSFKQIIIDALPFYNEEVILQKKRQAKLRYSNEQYPSWTRSIFIINNTLITDNLIQIEEIQHYFRNNNTAIRNDELINLNQYQKIGQIQKIELQNNKVMKINSIQFFHISKQIVVNLIDHFEHIAKDFKKDQVNEKKNYEKIDKIEMKATIFEIFCDQLNLTTESHSFELNIHYIQCKLGDKCCHLKLGRAYILDLHQQSKFKYMLDEEDLNEFEEAKNDLIKESPFLDLLMQFDQNSLVFKLQLKPVRICLSGYQFQILLKSFSKKEKEENSIFTNNNEEDDESFEIIKQGEPFNLQVELFPIQFIVSFDSEGLDAEGFKTQVLKLGSFNNLILATNQILHFYQQNSTSKQEFIQFLISQQLSTFRIIFQAYSTLDITKVASSFTDGIINMFSKPFVSNNGFVINNMILQLYGLIEGSYDFTCGVTSAVLQLAALPASALNNVANYIGFGAISIPFSQLEDFCKKLYYKINPEKGIPTRFFKDKYQ